MTVRANEIGHMWPQIILAGGGAVPGGYAWGARTSVVRTGKKETIS
jgi:hypothetical protein